MHLVPIFIQLNKHARTLEICTIICGIRNRIECIRCISMNRTGQDMTTAGDRNQFFIVIFLSRHVTSDFAVDFN